MTFKNNMTQHDNNSNDDDDDDDQGCIFRLTCSHRELTKDHVLTSVYVKNFRTVTRIAVNKGCLKENRLFLTSVTQTCNEYLIKFSENKKTSPFSPRAPN